MMIPSQADNNNTGLIAPPLFPLFRLRCDGCVWSLFLCTDKALYVLIMAIHNTKYTLHCAYSNSLRENSWRPEPNQYGLIMALETKQFYVVDSSSGVQGAPERGMLLELMCCYVLVVMTTHYFHTVWDRGQWYDMSDIPDRMNTVCVLSVCVSVKHILFRKRGCVCVDYWSVCVYLRLCVFETVCIWVCVYCGCEFAQDGQKKNNVFPVCPSSS